LFIAKQQQQKKQTRDVIQYQ